MSVVADTGRSSGRIPRLAPPLSSWLVGSRVVTLACVWLVACGNAPATSDAAHDASASDAGSLDAGPPPFEVAQPMLPVLTPCPPGWREVEDPDGPTICEPWPVSGAADCTGAEAHFPGEPGCAPIGRPCPADGFPADLPTDRPVVYVLAGATGGDGTRALPFGRIDDALAVAAAGSVVAIGRGEYDEAVRVTRGVSLRGACAGETVIRPSDASPGFPAVDLAETGSSISDVTIGPTPRIGLGVRGTAHVEGVAILAATGLGILAAPTAAVTGGDVIVRGTVREGPEVGVAGLGLAADTADVTLARVAIEGNAHTGVLAIDGARVLLEDAVVRDMVQALGGVNGYAIATFTNGSVEARRVVIEGAHEFGVFARGHGASVLLEDAVLRDTRKVILGGIPWRGRGLIAFEGADAVIRRALFERNHQQSIQARNEGTEVLIEDAVVRDTGAVSEPPPNVVSAGIGLRVHMGATGRVARALFDRNATLAVAMDFFDGVGTPTAATLEDVLVRDTVPQRGVGARSFQLSGPGTLDATRLRFEDSVGIALYVGGEGAVATLRDLTIADTAASDCGADCVHGGVGLGAYYQATVDLSRFRIERSALCAVHVVSEGVDIRDGLVAHNLFGACVQIAGFDVARLSSGVVYTDNESNLESTTLPVPDPLVAQ